jgi:hypothetical protein
LSFWEQRNYSAPMDLKKMSDQTLRQKLVIASFDAENLLNPDAKKHAKKFHDELKAEADRRFKNSTRKKRTLTSIIGRFLGFDAADQAKAQRHLRSSSDWKDR